MTPLALARYFLVLGATGFGGPIALVGYMQRDLVERRRWFNTEEFSSGLALAQISPGPLAAQLAFYLGWLRGGTRVAGLIAVAFIAPSLAMVVVIAHLYVRYGSLDWLQPAFAAVGAAVVGILVRSAMKVAGMTLARDRALWIIAAANMIGVLVLQRESLILLFIGGAFALFDGFPNRRSAVAMWPFLLSPPMRIAADVSPSALPPQLFELFQYFAVAGMVVFGSGLAIVPYLFHGVVEQHQWLTDRQFLDAIAVSMITPGPVVIMVAFIGHLIAGIGGALSSTLAVFLPAWLVVVVLAPYFGRIRRNAKARRFVEGVTAGATGAIAGAAIILSARILTSIEAVVIAVIVFVVTSSRVRIPEGVAIIGAACAGVALG